MYKVLHILSFPPLIHLFSPFRVCPSFPVFLCILLSAINKWQVRTSLSVTPDTLASLARFASEYLVHAADVEGLCNGIDEELVTLLATSPIPVTYAGGGRCVADLDLVRLEK